MSTTSIIPGDPKQPTDPTKTPIFVFGANELGRHGGGAAKAAMSHGARYGQGFGPQGNAFGIPTCSKPTNEPNSTITPDMLRYYIYCFILYAKMNPQLDFQVTRIGCGLAGWADAVVAPLFTEAPDNCFFDSAWDAIGLLPNRKYWGTYGGLVVMNTPHAAVNPAAIDTNTDINTILGGVLLD